MSPFAGIIQIKLKPYNLRTNAEKSLSQALRSIEREKLDSSKIPCKRTPVHAILIEMYLDRSWITPACRPRLAVRASYWDGLSYLWGC